VTNLEADELLRELIGEVRGLRSDVQALQAQPVKVEPAPAPDPSGVRQTVVTGEAGEGSPATAKPATKKAAVKGR